MDVAQVSWHMWEKTVINQGGLEAIEPWVWNLVILKALWPWANQSSSLSFPLCKTGRRGLSWQGFRTAWNKLQKVPTHRDLGRFSEQVAFAGPRGMGASWSPPGQRHAECVAGRAQIRSSTGYREPDVKRGNWGTGPSILDRSRRREWEVKWWPHDHRTEAVVSSADPVLNALCTFYLLICPSILR